MTQKALRVAAWVGGMLLVDAVVPRPGFVGRLSPLLPRAVVAVVRGAAGLPEQAPNGDRVAVAEAEAEAEAEVDDVSSREGGDAVHALRDTVADLRGGETAAVVAGDATGDDGVVVDPGSTWPAMGSTARAPGATTTNAPSDAAVALADRSAMPAGSSATPGPAQAAPAELTSGTRASAEAAAPAPSPAMVGALAAARVPSDAPPATTTLSPRSDEQVDAGAASPTLASAAHRSAVDAGVAPALDAGVASAPGTEGLAATAVPVAATTRPVGDARGFEFPDDTRTWDTFVDKIRAVQAGGRAKTRVVHLGDSEIAGDRFVSTLRADVAARIGLGGPGFALVSPPWHWYRRAGFADLSSTSFTHRSFIFGRGSGGNFGPGGVAFDATDVAARADVTLEPGVVGSACSVALLYAPTAGGGELEVFADGVSVGRVSLDGAPAVAAWRYAPEACPRRLSARVSRLPARLFGWSVESGAKGVVWTSLGIVGANASALSRYASGRLGEALAQLEPDLVVASYGLNLTGHGAPVPRSEGEQLVRLMNEIRAKRPDTACLVMSPYPVLVEADGALAPSETTKRLARVQRAAAFSAGCVFLDRERLVGGPEVALEWLNKKPRYLSGDYVHLTPAGASYVSRQVSRLLLGELFGG